MSLSLRKNAEILTYADYLSWPGDENRELIEGVPFDMSLTPSPYHQEISMNLSFEILRCIKEKKGNGRAEVFFKDDTIPLKLKEAVLEISLESVF